jgi:uncharacterized protein YkwD
MSVNHAKLKTEVVESHNLARTNPKAFIPILEKYMTYFKGKILNKPGNDFGIETAEGKEAYNECIAFLKKQAPVGKLTLDTELSKASQDHADDIGPSGSCDHVGTDGQTSADRIEKYIDWDVTLCENIDFGAVSGEEILISLLVDDGVPDRGHRNTIFNPKLKLIGVGIANHAEYGTCTVMDYIGGVIEYKNSSGSPKKPAAKVDDHKQAIGALKAAASKKGADDLAKELNKKAKIVSDNPFEDDPDAPANAVSVSIKTTSKKAGNKTTKKTVKTYTLDDGSQEIVELEEVSG